jgi:hypothetical protein
VLAQSRRYLPCISRAVNLVFAEATIRGLFNMDGSDESVQWKCPEHSSFNQAEEGFLQVIQAEKEASRPAISDFFKPVADALMAVKPWERGISTAILVRKNSFGEDILAYLKSVGIDRVVFEGDSLVMDSPVLAVFVEMVKLAEHPANEYAYQRIRHSPVATALYPDGLPPREELSLSLLADFTRMGMVRKFRDVREALKTVNDSWNIFIESRFSDLIKCAAEFEDVRDERTSLSDFADYLAVHSRRDYAEPGMVRILTMHQSKGLGFDHVIIPFFEPDGFHSARHRRPLVGKDKRWLSVDPSAEAALSDPVFEEADRRNRVIKSKLKGVEALESSEAERLLALDGTTDDTAEEDV